MTAPHSEQTAGSQGKAGTPRNNSHRGNHRQAWLLCRWATTASLLIFFLTLFISCQQAPEGAPIGKTYTYLERPEVWKVPVKSPAQLIGLKPGDVIISYDEQPVLTLTEFEDALTKAKSKPDSITLVILRDEQELTLRTKPGPLGFIPVKIAYSASLAKALEDILTHFGQTGYYDWLAAITNENMTLTVRDDDPFSWGSGGLSGKFLDGVANLTNLSSRLLWQWQATAETENLRQVIATGIKDHQVLLVQGGWADNTYQWGIVSRLNPDDTICYGYSVGNGAEQPLNLEQVKGVYEVRCRGKVVPDPADYMKSALVSALEIGLATADSGWHSGLEAYDIIVKRLNQFPLTPEGPDVATERFYQFIWQLLGHKESANRFFSDMREAFPESADLFDEVIGRNRAIISKLEGLIAVNLPLNSLENQQKVARVLVEIQEIENDILGIYEDILGEL